MKYPRRSQYKYAKSPYRIRNWPEYEAGLRRRGDLTIWFSDDAIKSWRAPTDGVVNLSLFSPDFGDEQQSEPLPRIPIPT